MSFISKFSLAFAIVGLAAVTSGSAQSGKKLTIILPAAANMSCPVAMRAEHGVDGSMLTVKGEKAHRGQGQQLELTLYNAKPGAISAVEIRAHGWNGMGRTLPARELHASDGNATETLDLALSIGPRASAETDVWVNGLTAVDSIDLIGVSYVDGSIWEPTTPEACSVTPDPMMLISQR
jgi:hypothetical protein